MRVGFKSGFVRREIQLDYLSAVFFKYNLVFDDRQIMSRRGGVA